ncbi:hypothetical protein DSO57_1021403 [Entomophthora muscae]|uniref:Uncharacterized protein n=1 Tax=Entomophthora muscae TaxID=34485 RepID=A0ACC2TRF3_9FUNG|nr:hypothetical protein DSO57_1021403 [Entomophthora muscae]
MLAILLHVVMVMGLGCNLIALCVIVRQDVRKPDLTLALVMAISDLVLVAFKLGESFLLSVLSGASKGELVSGQWKGIVSTYLLQLSAVSVGSLASLRFLVIFLKQRVGMKAWWGLFVVPQVVILGLLVAVAAQGQYEDAQVMSVMYPALNSGSEVVELCRYFLLVSFAWPVLAVNISYPCIARLYEAELRLIEPGGFRYKQTRTVYVKIISFVIIYNVVMLPSIIVLILEAATRVLQSETLESIAVVALFSMTFFNPLVLLTLHHETYHELQDFLAHWKLKLTPIKYTTASQHSLPS